MELRAEDDEVEVDWIGNVLIKASVYSRIPSGSLAGPATSAPQPGCFASSKTPDVLKKSVFSLPFQLSRLTMQKIARSRFRDNQGEKAIPARSRIASLIPWLDDEGMLRVRG